LFKTPVFIYHSIVALHKSVKFAFHLRLPPILVLHLIPSSLQPDPSKEGHEIDLAANTLLHGILRFQRAVFLKRAPGFLFWILNLKLHSSLQIFKGLWGLNTIFICSKRRVVLFRKIGNADGEMGKGTFGTSGYTDKLGEWKPTDDVRCWGTANFDADS